MSAIRKARRERQAAHIEPDNVTDSTTGNIIPNPKVFNDDGTRRNEASE